MSTLKYGLKNVYIHIALIRTPFDNPIHNNNLWISCQTSFSVVFHFHSHIYNNLKNSIRTIFWITLCVCVLILEETMCAYINLGNRK